MPYDPEWGPEKVEDPRAGPQDETSTGGGLLGDQDFEMAREHDTEHLSAYQVMGEKVVRDSQGDHEGSAHEEDDIEIDLPVLPKQDRQPLPDLDPGPTPKSKIPPLMRSSQVEVVLNSSPKKTPYSIVPDDLSDDQLSMVTSDVLPGAQTKRFHKSPPKIPQLPSTTQTQTIVPQPKKRGRPFGWRPGSGPYSKLNPGSSAPRGPKPINKPAGEHKKPGRPPGRPSGKPWGKPPGRPPAPIGRQVYIATNPHFLVFKCEWQGCPAELHNLETLRKHILFVHGRPPPPSEDFSSEFSSSRPGSSHSLGAEDRNPQIIICKWHKCPTSNSSSNPPIAFDPSTFPDHAEQTHILPVLWLLGDGPQNTSCTSVTTAPLGGNKLPPYLFDESNTVQITPDVRHQQLENGEDKKKRMAKIDRILAQQNDNAPPEPEYTDEQVEDIARAMDEKKKRQKMFRDYADKHGAENRKRMRIEKEGGLVEGGLG